MYQKWLNCSVCPESQAFTFKLLTGQICSPSHVSRQNRCDCSFSYLAMAQGFIYVQGKIFAVLQSKNCCAFSSHRLTSFCRTMWSVSRVTPLRRCGSFQLRLCNVVLAPSDACAATLLITPNASIPVASTASWLQMSVRSELTLPGPAAAAALFCNADKTKKIYRSNSWYF